MKLAKIKAQQKQRREEQTWDNSEVGRRLSLALVSTGVIKISQVLTLWRSPATLLGGRHSPCCQRTLLHAASHINRSRC